ncbi:hypothetical protein PCO82_05025 [Pectobacteriaceae bacterium CE90]|nr:hypothetical protein [Prodigiosinella sp. LS101]WJV52919.1 hypothetical protein PCO85_17205 [Prodigiosinella sp. LS101]WJV57274.1 hypothetical protein PCO84_17185 [Pectobacteriaceae bacterium C111]WJY14509.1 hypothetical protein PCO82_18790 [Pectobacteriaceae bacterium CE90]WJY16047.1 hypothetical protein PCO82_05025 [Pectobacteriaceae bacterium CE90]
MENSEKSNNAVIDSSRQAQSKNGARVTHALQHDGNAQFFEGDCSIFVEVLGTLSDTVFIRVDHIVSVINTGNGSVVHLSSGEKIEVKHDAVALMSHIKNVYENIRNQIPEYRNYLPKFLLCRIKDKYTDSHEDGTERLNNRDESRLKNQNISTKES